MRMKMVCDDRTLREVANEFLALKKAQKVRERTLSDYKKYIDKFLDQSQNTLDVDVLKIEILEYFADIPKTSPAKEISNGGVKVGIEVTGVGAALDGILDCMARFGRVALLECTRSSDFTIDYYRKVHGLGITLVGAHTNARPAV